MIMKCKIAKGGKISIPAYCRKHFKLQEGDEIVFTINGEEISFSPLRLKLEKVRRIIREHPEAEQISSAAIIAQRRIEAANE